MPHRFNVAPHASLDPKALPYGRQFLSLQMMVDGER